VVQANVISDPVDTWMASNRLRLNQDKTQFLWCCLRQKLTKRDLGQLAAISLLLVSLNTVKDLGVITDSELTFEQHCIISCLRPVSSTSVGCGLSVVRSWLQL